MKPGLEPGQRAEIQRRVTADMCPHFDGALVHPTYATWTMVHHMEVAGRMLLAPHLEPHEEAVGAHISVDHKAPAPIGSLVTVSAEVESNDGRKLICRVAARVGDRLIGAGRFTQAILPRDVLARRIAQSAPDPPSGMA
jgi:predicted thioesterase